MPSGAWTWLEVIKLVVAALTPLLVLGLGVVVSRAARRVEDAQWANRKLIERRLDLFDKMSEPLNDLFCFFRLVGDFQNITPPTAIERKRTLDKLFYTHEALMSHEFAQHYGEFMAACFETYVGLGRDATLKASEKRQRAERGERWQDNWSRHFVDQESLITSLSTISGRYRSLMDSFAGEVGARR